MKISTLVENKTSNPKLKHAHGLSFYIETKNHKLLFDLGPNQFFVSNAKKLGIDLTEVDTLVISHGHYDHERSIQTFLNLNQKAKVYVSKTFFEKHVKKIGNVYLNIGVKKPSNLSRFIFVEEDTVLDEELSLYTNVPFEKQIIKDTALMAKKNGDYILEEYDHEMYMSIFEGNHQVLISGCSHKGIEHIVDTIEKNHSIHFTEIIGGYHFSHYDSSKEEETTYLHDLGRKFFQRNETSFYSCHCTGDNAFNILKEEMKDHLTRIMTGNSIEI